MDIFYAVIIVSLFRLTDINIQVIKHSKKKNEYNIGMHIILRGMYIILRGKHSVNIDISIAT